MYNHKGWTFPDIDSHFRDSVGEFPETTYQQGALDAAFKYVKKFNVAIDAGANIGLQLGWHKNLTRFILLNLHLLITIV